MLGREVITLTDRQFEAGYHRLPWNGKDAKDNPLVSGVYLYHFRAGVFFGNTEVSCVDSVYSARLLSFLVYL